MGGTFKDKGLVIREYKAGERDKRLTLLMADRGKVTVFAKGAQGTAGKTHAAAQLFAFSDFVIYEGTGFLTVAQASVLENFYGVRGSLDRLACASHAVELSDMVMLPGVACRDELILLYLALARIADGTCSDPLLAALAFELKFYQLEGLAPRTDGCAGCGGKPADVALFTAQGLLCPACAYNSEEAVRLSQAVVYAMNYILNANFQDIFKFSLTERGTGQLSAALGLYRRSVLEAPPKSLDILE